METKSRRGFLGTIAAGAVGVGAVLGRAFADTAKAPATTTPAAAPAGAAPAAAPKMIDLNDPVAKALKYTHDKAAVDKALQVDKMGVKFADQTCANCVHFNKTAQVDGKDVGTCNMLIGKGNVAAAGWCNVWTKKA